MEQPLSYQFFNSSISALDAMRQAILGARKSIFWEIYMFADDSAGSRFIDALCAKAGQGVEVKIILDSFGSSSFSRGAERRLRLSGAQILWYNHFQPDLKIGKWLGRLWNRNHRKILIIDEKIVFIGGVNVSAAANDWYDLHLRLNDVESPALLRSFAKSYVRCGGNAREVRHLLTARRDFAAEQTEKKFNFIIHSPGHNARHPFLLRRFYWRALKTAASVFNLATPYYVPDVRFLQLVSRACRRGVKVNIILPWRPDHKFMQIIANGFYDLTRRAGAAFYFLPKMNHAKAFSVDNSLGMVGSINLTPRSFFANQEIGVHFNDSNMVGDLNNIFDNWKKESAPLSEMSWQKRGWHRRFREWWAEKIRDYV